MFIIPKLFIKWLQKKLIKYYEPVELTSEALEKILNDKKKRKMAEKLNITILTIATGKYERYIEGFCSSFNKYFLKNHNVNIIVFTDCVDKLTIRDNVTLCPTQHRPWPMSTLMRFSCFCEHFLLYEESDYVVFADSDMFVVDEIKDEEILPSNGLKLFAVLHPGYANSDGGPFEIEMNSKAFVPLEKRGQYFQGCLFGGTSDAFLKLSLTCKKNIDEDLNKGLVARWHDESHQNFYLSMVEKPKVLPPSFAYPEVNGSGRFGIPDIKKIIHLDKDHNTMRGITQ